MIGIPIINSIIYLKMFSDVVTTLGEVFKNILGISLKKSLKKPLIVF
jgi:hypothetical protein